MPGRWWRVDTPSCLDDLLASLRLSPIDTFYVEQLPGGESRLVLLVQTVRLAERCQRDPRLEQRTLRPGCADHLAFVCPIRIMH